MSEGGGDAKESMIEGDVNLENRDPNDINAHVKVSTTFSTWPVVPHLQYMCGALGVLHV